MIHRAVLLVAALFVSSTAGAGPLADGGRATVASVVDGDTVILDDARQVRLPGLQAPKLPLGRKGFRKWPLADQSKEALESLINGRVVDLRYGGARSDRHGRVLAHVYRDDGLWVQGAMLRLGMARLYSFPDNRALVAEMRAAEQAARQARRGIWRLDYYAVRTPDTVAKDVGTFQVVEGIITDAAKVKRRVYLNFGADWRSDFTIRLDAKALKLFSKAGLDPATWSGRRIEVRGWVSKQNGPMIKASHPEQIQLLGP